MTKRLFICYVNVVLVSLCGRFVAVLVCGRIGWWSFWFVAVSVAVLVCGLLGCMPALLYNLFLQLCSS